MAELTANLQIQFASFAADTPFELVVDETDQVGSVPVHVDYSLDYTIYLQSAVAAIITSSSKKKEGDATSISPLEKMITPGRKRIKVFCSQADAPFVRIFVDNGEKQYSHIEIVMNGYQVPGSNMGVTGFTFGSVPPPRWVVEWISTVVTALANRAVLIGRLSAPITEAINWTGDQRKRLRYFYDRPSVAILQSTIFRDKTGAEIPAPVYDQERGEFHTTDLAYGAIVVRYSPEFSLYEVLYDTGKPVASTELWEEMQRAWAFGNIKNASVPPVRLYALSQLKATTASFERTFWPPGYPVAKYGTPNSAWNNIDLSKHNLTAKPGDRVSTETVNQQQGNTTTTPDENIEDLLASLMEKPGTRQTVTVRVFNEADTSLYIDVQKIIYLEAVDSNNGQVFKIRMLNE
jgi:hypothetical protein